MTAARVLLSRLAFSFVGVSGGCMLFNPLDPPGSQNLGGAGSLGVGGTVSQEAGAAGTGDGGRLLGPKGGTTGALGGHTSTGGITMADAGAGAEASGGAAAGSAGTQGTSGSGGTDAITHCSSNADCYAATEPPAYCRLPEGLCVRLDSPTCKVTGDPTNPRALFFGAFAPFGDTAAAHTVRDTYDLAFNEFMQSRGLLSADGRHPLVMVLCDSDGGPSVIDEGARHLVEDVQVPAVLAALSSADLQRTFEKYGRTFYLSPQTVSLELAREDADGLVWNLLGRTGDLQGIYARVVAQLEAYLRKLDPSITSLKVAIVTELANSEANELSVSVLPGIHFNGDVSFTANVSQGNGLLVDVSSTEAAQRVIDFAPHVVISLARNSFTQFQGFAAQVEQRLLNRPYYLLSPWNSAAADDLRTLFQKEDEAGIPQAQRRFLGIDAASALDGGSRDVKNEYVSRLRSLHANDSGDFENYYDAFYYLVYAMYAGGFPVTSYGTARGMQRLYQGTQTYYVGPTDMFKTLTWLQGRDPMRLMGALGAPTFDVTGGRVDTGSVYCFDDSSPPILLSSVLGYDVATDKLYATTPTLLCLTNFL